MERGGELLARARIRAVLAVLDTMDSHTVYVGARGQIGEGERAPFTQLAQWRSHARHTLCPFMLRHIIGAFLCPNGQRQIVRQHAIDGRLVCRFRRVHSG